MLGCFLELLGLEPVVFPPVALCSFFSLVLLSSLSSGPPPLVPALPSLTVHLPLVAMASVTVAAGERQLLPFFIVSVLSFSLTSSAAVYVVSHSDTYTVWPAICSASPLLQLPKSQPVGSILILAYCHYCLLLLAPLPLCCFCSFFFRLGRHC